MASLTSFLTDYEGIDWESDDVEDAATKIQVKTIVIKSTVPATQRRDFLGGKLDAPWRNWKERRKMKKGMKKTKRRAMNWMRMRTLKTGKIDKHESIALFLEVCINIWMD